MCACGQGAHAEGTCTLSLNNSAHAEGSRTQALAAFSHAEGSGTVAEGVGSHAEGEYTHTIGRASHASGIGTIAYDEACTVVGKYNDENSGSDERPLFVVGCGTREKPKNALWVDAEKIESRVTI